MNPPIIIIYTIVKELYINWKEFIVTIIISGITLLIGIKLLEYITETLAMSILSTTPT